MVGLYLLTLGLRAPLTCIESGRCLVVRVETVRVLLLSSLLLSVLKLLLHVLEVVHVGDSLLDGHVAWPFQRSFFSLSMLLTKLNVCDTFPDLLSAVLSGLSLASKTFLEDFLLTLVDFVGELSMLLSQLSHIQLFVSLRLAFSCPH